MKKTIKTYGVRGLMEWVCNIPVGKTHMRVEFTGGVLTSYGNTPAKFTTDDPFKQTVIEHSEWYKSGRIKLLHFHDIGEDSPSPVSPQSPSEDSPVPESFATVEVSSLDDAKTYLNETFGISVRELRSKKSVLDAASRNGLSFKFPE